MGRVAIMTDSTASLPAELVSEYDITILPLLIAIGDRSFRDGVDITPGEVYRLMREQNCVPKTSAPSPAAFLECYRRLSQSADSILCVTLTSRYSMAFEAAVQASQMAKEELPDLSIQVLDSRTVAGALGLVVLEAARTASQGADLPQVVDTARAMIPRVHLIAVLDTLRYLQRGGRIGRAAAWAGTLFSIKPILECSTATGYTEPMERPRTKPRAMTRLLDLMAERVQDSATQAIVHHAGSRQEGESLKAQVASRFKCAELHLTEFTPLMGSHTGPGLVGIAFTAAG
jgi:DegV family protein with EDD domain